MVVFPATAVLLLLSLGGSTYAHHGFASWFDMTRSTTVKGTVRSFDWTNPLPTFISTWKMKGATLKSGAPNLATGRKPPQ
jgi:hypothetical protein